MHPSIPHLSLPRYSYLVPFIVWPPDGVTTGVGGWWRENERVQGVSKMGGIKRESAEREGEQDEGGDKAKNRQVKKLKLKHKDY